MPLTRYDDNYREDEGDVVFRMKDGEKLVPCRVTREALENFTETTGVPVLALFEDNRDLVERAASNVYNAGGRLDEEGKRVLVLCEDLKRASGTT